MRRILVVFLMAGCTADDADGDGLASSVDCDDDDATRGGAEVPADRVDNDCDGVVDCDDDDLVHGEPWVGDIDLWEGAPEACADVDCRIVVGSLRMDGGSRSDEELDAVPGLDLSCVTHVTGHVGLAQASYPFRGLRGLTEIGGGLEVSYSHDVSFVGLHSLRRARGLGIFESGVTSLEGLEHLTSVDSISLGRVSGLTSLDGLDGLRWVPGTVQIDVPELASLRGLHHLEGVGDLYGNCQFSLQAGQLETLTELESLRVIGCPFGVGFTPLTDLAGLEGVSGLPALHLAHLDRLASLAGVEQVESIGSLSVSDVPALTSLSALSGLRWVGDVHIGEPVRAPWTGELIGWDGADALTSLDGLEGVEVIGGALFLGGNDHLVSLDALGGVVAINGSLVVQENAALTDVTGLSSVREVYGDVTITDNPALGDAAAQALVAGIDVIEGTVTITGNEPAP